MSHEPTLTATSSPSPRVRVDFDTLLPDTATVTVYRSYEGEVQPVRDAINGFAVGGFTITDYEVPLGVTVAYSAEMFDADGTLLGSTGTTEAALFGERGWVWVSNPLDPTDSVLVGQLASFADGVERSRPAEKYNVGNQVVTLYGPRGLIEGITLDCLTETREKTDRLDAILAAGLVLFRTMPGVELPRLLYVYVASPRRVAVNHRSGGEITRWEIVADEVTAPTLSAGVFEGTWQDVIDNFATWQDVIDNYPTWLDLLKNPPGV